MKIIKAVLLLSTALFCISACGGPVEGGGTALPDTTPPEFLKGDPDGNVTRACSVTAAFDDVLLASSITPQSFIIKNTADANPLSTSDGTWGLSPSSNTIAVFNPSAALAVGTYDVTLTTAIKNVAGLNLAAEQTFRFTTTQLCTQVDTDPPLVVSRRPVGTETFEVCTVEVTFNEPILNTTITPQSFIIQPGIAPDLGTAFGTGDGSWSLPADNVAVFDPSANLIGDFTVTLTTDITDLAGNKLTGQSWTFNGTLPCTP